MKKSGLILLLDSFNYLFLLYTRVYNVKKRILLLQFILAVYKKYL